MGSDNVGAAGRLTISEIMHMAIANKVFPGGAVAFGTSFIPCFHQGFGTYTYESNLPTTSRAIWDVASLTKILATVPAVMLLFERGLLDLEAPACAYLPPFGCNGKQRVSIRMLLSHTAGLREWHPFFQMGLETPSQVVQFVIRDKLWYPPASAARYSDLSMIVLGLIVEAVTKQPLNDFVHSEFYAPLGMQQTGFRRHEEADFDPLIVPTEVDRIHRRRLLWGEVHDPTAWIMGGVGGHAGLFSSVKDVSKFAQMLLAGGIDTCTNRRFDLAARRGVEGYTSAGRYMGPRTFGHTGYTGTSLWIDPDRNIFVVLLSNAVHPTADEEGALGKRLRDVRPMIADACVAALGEQAFPPWDHLTWHRVRRGRAEEGVRRTDLEEYMVELCDSLGGADRKHMRKREVGRRIASMCESSGKRRRWWVWKSVVPVVVMGALWKMIS